MVLHARDLSWLCILPLLAGCHSVTRIRLAQEVRTAGDATLLELWVHAPGPLLSDPPNVVYDVCMPLVLYPVDKLFGIVSGVAAAFDDDVDVEGGPIGFAAGAMLPWLTLLPYIFPPFAPGPVELAPARYAELLARIEAGDGVRAYVDIVGAPPADSGVAGLHSVRVLRGEWPRMLKGHDPRRDDEPQR